MNLLLSAVMLLQDTAAEEAFSKMEKSWTGAKTLSLRFKYESRGPGDDPRPGEEGSGLLLLKEGNKARIEVDSISHDLKEHLDQPWKLILISDGRRVFSQSGPPVTDARSQTTPTPADLKDEYSLLVSRLGWNTDRFLLVATGSPRRVKSDFTLVKVQSGIDPQKRGLVTYTIQSTIVPGAMARVELLYEGGTGLPLQRKIVPSGADQPTRTETYLEFVVGGEIPDDRFVLPGEKKGSPRGPDAGIVSCLKGIAEAEADFRENDRDNNKIHDYWVGDISGLYRFLVDGAQAREIENAVAQADGAPLESPELSPRLVPKPVPLEGYLVVALRQYEEKGKALPYDPGTHRNPSRFGICAYPVDPPGSGRWTWIQSESGKRFRKDTGGKVPDAFPEDPAKAGWELVP